METNHPQCVSLGYLNINSARNKFYSIPPLIEHNIDILAIAETKLDSLFPKRQFLLERMKRPYSFDISSRKRGLLVHVNKNIPHQNMFEVSIFQMTYRSFPHEVNIKQHKLLVASMSRPPDQKLTYFCHL